MAKRSGGRGKTFGNAGLRVVGSAYVYVSVAAMATFLCSLPASAQVQEIIVTAQKREQSLINVPTAITALSPDRIAKQNLQYFTAVSTLVPNFNVAYERGSNATPSLTLRGISSDNSSSRVNESSVAVYSDEVYLGDETMLTGAIFDMARIEVLRGPQGTLFGRNTTGGLIHFISASPTKAFSGFGSALYGANNQVTLEGAVSGPLSDRIRVRLAGKLDRNDGNYKNTEDLDPTMPGYQRAPGVPSRVGAREVWGLRGTVDIDLSDTVLLRLIGLHSENHSQTADGRAPGVLDPADPTGRTFCSLDRVLQGDCVSITQLFYGQPANTDRQPGEATTNLTKDQLAIRQKTNSFTARLTADLDWAKLTSISNYSNNRYNQGLDADTGPDPVGAVFDVRSQFNNREWQASQELRLNNSTKLLDWVAGGYFYTDSKRSHMYTQAVSFGAPAGYSDSKVDTKSGAVFSQVDVHLSRQWELSVGGRYTDEQRSLKRAIATVSGFGSENVLAQVADPAPETRNLTGKVGVTWKPSANNSVYFNYSRGAKSPGFNTYFSGSPSAFGGGNARSVGPVGEEKLDAFELGWKTRLFDHKLSINSAAFYYNFHDKQEILYRFVDNVILPDFININSVRLYGAETEIAFTPDQHWDVNLNAGWLENKITKSDIITPNPLGAPTPLKGQRLPRTPKWNFAAILAYHIPTNRLGTFTVQGEANGVASQNDSITNFYLSKEPARVTANFRLLWASSDGKHTAEAFVTNAFNKNYFLNAFDAVINPANGGFIASVENEGRLWGLKVGTKF